ncbi:MAG: FKBP-type peptidyl-prolyl cis-trans isomerase [Bacteroidaceae bacterium]|nr:FKBP-type peptidyl-prolyl cis-trans isomerase [Bacteroidaceae bacterium]
MKKFVFKYIVPALLLFGFVACDETEEVQEFGNWKSRNIAYIDSIAKVARTNADGDWKVFLAYGLNSEAEYGNEYYVYCNVLSEGNGTVNPVYSDTVECNYRGRLIPTHSYKDGYIFDETFTGELDPEVDVPLKLTLAGCVRGWITAMMEMVEGDVWRIYVPSELGYNTEVVNSIPAYSTLVFDINLVDIYSIGDR